MVLSHLSDFFLYNKNIKEFIIGKGNILIFYKEKWAF